MESLLKNLKEHVTCSICLDTFTDPKTITCLHTFCFECIKKHALISQTTFWRETSPKSLPPGNRGSTQNIRWFLKTHYNHKLKISITAKRSYQIKIIKVFFFGRRVCGWVGILGEFSCLNWSTQLWVLEIQVLINSFIFLFIFYLF